MFGLDLVYLLQEGLATLSVRTCRCTALRFRACNWPKHFCPAWSLVVY